MEPWHLVQRHGLRGGGAVGGRVAWHHPTRGFLGHGGGGGGGHGGRSSAWCHHGKKDRREAEIVEDFVVLYKLCDCSRRYRSDLKYSSGGSGVGLSGFRY